MSKQYREFIGQVVRSLPTEEELNPQLMQRMINNKSELRKILREDFVETSFPVFKTVEVGTYRSAEALIADIEAEGNRLSDWAEDVMNQSEFTLAREREEIDLVVLSVADLGFEDGAEYSDIMERAKELGLDLCPAEVAPQLRLAYSDQPKGDYLVVAHEPITDSDGSPFLLNVDRNGDGARWLYASDGALGRRWVPDRRFVFARRK